MRELVLNITFETLYIIYIIRSSLRISTVRLIDTKTNRKRLTIKGIQRKMNRSAQCEHPITEEQAFQLFLEWLQRSDKRLDLAAETLGVSIRTAQRWLQRKRVPRRIAVMLEQVKNGPVVSGGLWRGRGALIRYEWRPYLKTKIRELQ